MPQPQPIQLIEPRKEYESIAKELIAMVEVDQAMRREHRVDLSVDINHANRLAEIIDQIGWPTVSKVGTIASNRAWTLAQHSDHSLPFQKRCLALMLECRKGDVAANEVAYLRDRTLKNSGLPQIYGSQSTAFPKPEATWEPHRLIDPGSVDLLRESVGLPKLSVYVAQMDQLRKNHLEAESLSAEFRQRFVWSGFVDKYRNFLDAHCASEPELKASYLQDLLMRQAELEACEFKFADRVIEGYVRWSKETAPVVLWDIDETIGSVLVQEYGIQDFPWGFRPCFLELINFLVEKFPTIKNGILSGRGLNQIKDQLSDPRQLAAISSFIDSELIYSAGRAPEGKTYLLWQLRNELKLNIKTIDDDPVLAKSEPALGLGVSAQDCHANPRYSIVIA